MTLNAFCCFSKGSRLLKHEFSEGKDEVDHLESLTNLETGGKKLSSARKSDGVFLEQERSKKEMPETPRVLAGSYVYITRLPELFSGCFLFCLK